MRRLVPIALAAAVLAGCGSSGGGSPPTACLSSTAVYLKALGDAPGAVRLGGETPISDCFGGAEGAGNEVGQTIVEAATRLNAAARRHPGGGRTVSLGYLDGAVHEGASRSGGIDTELVRRVDTAARFAPGGGSPGAAFERAFGKGYAAGESTG